MMMRAQHQAKDLQDSSHMPAKGHFGPRPFVSLMPEQQVSITEAPDRIAQFGHNFGEVCLFSIIQPKLKVGLPNDRYEQEADRVAEQVMRMPCPLCENELEDGETVQAKSVTDRITSLVQEKAKVEDAQYNDNPSREKRIEDQTAQISPYVESHILSIGEGLPLPESERSFFEPRFNHDFNRVRIHADAEAALLAQGTNSQAFTVGHDIVFGAGKYAPGTIEGKQLLAHELTHVIQQHESPFMKSIQRNGRATLPSWSRNQLRSIQVQLRRLGLYRLNIDETFGPATESALIEAFGGNDWRGMSPDNIISRLTGASPPSGTRGEHRLRYGEMFRDRILDMTLGVGFDESSSHLQVIADIRAALAARNFRENRARAVQLYSASGRTIDSSAFGLFFVRDNLLTYRPPAGMARQIHAVIRLVTSPTGSQGQEAATAFKEGMVHSDIAFYSGHGRYGSGPDFDRNMRFELLDDRGGVLRQIDDYHVLERELSNEGRGVGRGAWQQFLWRISHNRIRVISSNLGNIYLNPSNLHSGEFGARLMYWVLNHGRTSPVTGRGRALSREVQATRERRYRLWVFDGCRTQDYVRSIRGTPGLDTASTDLMVSQRTLYWRDNAATLVAFLDSVLGQQSAENIIQNMDSQNVTERPSGEAGVSFSAQGIEDNPVIQ